MVILQSVKDKKKTISILLVLLAKTIFTEDQHYLVKYTDHNHVAEASQVKVIKSFNLLKGQAQQTNDQTLQVN
jgi:hypothetical protein